MTGSTSLEEEMDAETVRALIDRFYAALRAEVDKRGGRVVKFTGDGLMAAFGVPEVHEDDATRAIDAAVAMCGACEEIAQASGFPSIALKVGINTGEVVVIEDEDDVVGDAVNVASRLEGAAAAGEILVGEGTWRLTRGTSRYEPIDPLVLKGKAEPVPAYRLLSVDDSAAELATPFVGRDAELEKLLVAFDDVVESNSARLVTIIGSPGLGKTRLARELAARLADRAVVRETRCDPTSATLAPIAEALREANSIPESSDEQQILTALLERIPADEPERERIASRAAAILGAGVPGSTEETFWALRRMIEVAATRELPRVLVLEDLHWAEPLLLDLVEHLAEWITDAPVLLVGTARPEFREMRPSLVEGGRTGAVIALEGLDEQATARLARGLLGTEQVPAELLAKIPESTEGNPLFVRELVRMLVDDGVLQRTADGWSVTVDVEAIQVPPTIQSLLAARVDRLRSDERSVIELAAVVGKEFYRGALLELAPAGVRDQVDACLESLRRKELVEPVGTYWIDEPVYRFHHVLIRDAAYRRLLKETRAELHESVAGWYERKTQDILGEHEEIVGYHLEQAHEYQRQLGRANEALGRRAAELLRVAAQRALDRDDLPGAASLSGRALARLPETDTDRTETLLIRCEALLSMGDVTSGAQAVDDLDRIADSPRLSAWATCFAGQLANLTAPERLQETEKKVAAAATELSDLGDPAGAAKAHTVHGATLARLGRFGECEAALDEALTAAREAGDRRRITAVLSSAPLAALWGPNPVSRAGGRCLDLVRLSRITTGSPGVEVTSLRCQAVLEAFRGRSDAARRMLRSATRTLTELGLRYELLETEQFSGIVELVAGDAAAAEGFLRSAHDGFQYVGVDVLAAQTAALLARAYLLLGEDDEAEQFAAESEQLGGQDLKASIAWRAVKAELLAHRGEMDAARSLAESAVELAARTDALIDHGDALRALAAVCAAAGDTAAARSASDRAFALYERKGATALIDAPTAEVTDRAELEPSRDAPENDAVRNARRIGELFERRDWEAIAAMLAENIKLFDRRRVVGVDVVDSREKYIEQFKIIADFGTRRIVPTVIATRGDRLALMRCAYQGTDFGTSPFQVELLLVFEFDEGGLHTAGVLFDLDNLDEATAELDRRLMAMEIAQTLAQTLENECIRVLRTFLDAFEARDWERVAALHREDFTMEDRRLGLGMTYQGRDTQLEVVKGTAEVGTTNADLTPIATRGSRLSLVSTVWRGPTATAFGSEFLAVSEIDEAGRIFEIVVFEPDKLDAAFEELDERFAAGEQTSLAAIDVLSRIFRALNDRAWDALRDSLADDFELVDHRPASLGKLQTPEPWITSLQELTDIVPCRFEVLCYHALEADKAVLTARHHGVTDEGAEIESVFHQVCEFRAGRAIRLEIFPTQQLDAAKSRFEEIGRAFENDAVRAWLGLARTFEARDWRALSALFADDVIFDDRRPLIANPASGRDAIVELAQTIAASGVIRSELTTIATRGQRLMLGRVLLLGRELGSGAFETEILLLIELDGQGLIRTWVAFDPKDFDAAFAELDDRFIAGEGEHGADVVRLFADFNKSYNDRDWQRFSAFMTEDFLFVDHRLTALGTIGRDEYIHALRELIKLIPGRRLYVTSVLALAPTIGMTRVEGSGLSADGAATSHAFNQVWVLEGRRLARLELYPEDRVDAALARFEELSRARSPSPSNACLEAVEQELAAYEAGDWTAIREMVADDATNDDRRSGLRFESAGRDAYVEAIQGMAALGATALSRQVVAIRGERLCLTRVLWGSRDPSAVSEAEVLRLHEVDDTGRICAYVGFDPDDIEAAFVELDGRYMAGEGADYAEPVGCVSRFRDAVNARDWTALRDLFTEDLEFIDHRPVYLGEIHGPDEWIDSIKALLDVVDVKHEVVAYYRFHGDVFLYQGAGRGLTDEGAAVEMPFFVLGKLRERRLAHYEMFAIDAFDAARARFEELNVRPAAAAATLENACTRTGELIKAGIVASDWGAVSDLLSEDVLIEDRRRGISWTMRGRGEALEAIRVSNSLGAPGVRTLAICGDRLALFEVEYELRTDFKVEILQVVEVDDDGRQSRLVLFDRIELDRAMDELDRRYAAGEGAEHATVWKHFVEFHRLLNARDWDAVRATYADDLELIDHRPASLGQISGGDKMVEAARTLSEVVPDIHWLARDAVRVQSHGGVARMLLSGTNDGGGEMELEFFVLFVIEGGVTSRLEFFPLEQRDEALARFEELAKQSGGESLVPANDVTRVARGVTQAFIEGDWERFARFYAPDGRIDDRRSGVAYVTAGRDELVRQAQATVSVGADVLELKTLATRGSRLALFHARFANSDPGKSFEVEQLQVVESADAGIATTIMFDVDDLDSAIAELEKRYMSSEGAPYADVWAPCTAAAEAYARRDWNTFMSLLTDDFDFIDHRPASLGRIEGREALVRSQTALIELVPDMCWRFVTIRAIDAFGCVVQMTTRAIDAEGGHVEFAVNKVFHVHDGRIAGIEFFAIEDRDAALARFEELRHASATGIDNDAVRWHKQVNDLLVSGDWDAYTAHFAENAIFEDRRRGMTLSLEGKRAVLDHITVATPGVTMQRFPIATRGQRLVLVRDVATTRAGFEVEVLAVHEYDARGLQVYTGLFDPDHLHSAYAELDARYAAGEAATCRSVWDAIRLTQQAYNARDWDSLRTILASDVAIMDHRPAGSGRFSGIENWISHIRRLLELTPDAKTYIAAVHRLTAEGGVFQFDVHGTNEEGGSIEIPSHVLFEVRGGSVTRIEQYPLDQLSEAVARFDELGAETGLSEAALPENAAYRSMVQSISAQVRGDWDAVASSITDDIVFDDRRRGLGWVMAGRDVVMEHLQLAFARSDVTTSREFLIATRGERLCLGRQIISGGGYEVEVLVVVETDEDGVARRVVSFDPGDQDAAFAELDARWFASGEANDLDKMAVAWLEAYDAREWSRLRSLIHDDFVRIDHRETGFGTMGADAYIDYLRLGTQMSPDRRTRLVATFGGPDSPVRLLRSFASDDFGGSLEWERLSVARLRGDRVACIEEFSSEHLDEAIARADALAAPDPLSRLPENLAYRAMVATLDATVRADWDAFREGHTEDLVYDDRRVGLGWTLEGRDAIVEALHSYGSPRNAMFDSALLAIRGQRLCLGRWKVNADDNVLESIVVVETDDSGKTRLCVFFDTDDFQAAFDELDHRFVEGEGSTCRDVVEFDSLMNRTYNQRDWDAHRAMVDEEFELIDHHEIGAGTVAGGDWIVAYMQPMTELAPDLKIFTIEYLGLARDRVLARLLSSGHTPEGAHVEREIYATGVIRDGKLVSSEKWPEDGREAAISRWNELLESSEA